MVDAVGISARYGMMVAHLDERTRRVVAAAEARAAGRGGVVAVCAATGMARSTIGRGLKELDGGPEVAPNRKRRSGGGRKRAEAKNPGLLEDLQSLVAPVTRGDPETPLLWTAKSVRRLAKELKTFGHRVSHVTVGRLLRGLGYSLQANVKTKEGTDHPDRDAQFKHINAEVTAALETGQPVISVDTKKKELVGDFKNNGREWRPQGDPDQVQVHDFLNKELGRAVPYGIYDLADNTGWVSVGMSADTSAFAVEAIRRWWRGMGRESHPGARRLLINADGGGSNGWRVRLWKLELQHLANETGLEIQVMHLPPGTSKWNKIEHRLFSFISQNWRARPLISYQVIVQLIAATTTDTGLKVHCELDENTYQKGIKVTDSEMNQINITPSEFHGEWNYTISPSYLKIEAVNS